MSHLRPPALRLTAAQIFEEDPERGSIARPIKYPVFWGLRQAQVRAHWTADEIPWDQDMVDFPQLPEDVQHMVLTVMAFFTGADNLVIKNLVEKFQQIVKVPEMVSFYIQQTAIEDIHAEVYADGVEALVPDPVKRNKLLHLTSANAEQKGDATPAILAKNRWALDWITKDASYGQQTLAWACVEGIFFSGSFCVIFWVAQAYPGKMPGLVFSNQQISKDEGLHYLFADTVHYNLAEDLQVEPATIHAIIREAVDVEAEFMKQVFQRLTTGPDGEQIQQHLEFVGMDYAKMLQYVQFVADTVATDFEQPKIYNVANPFTFMNTINQDRKTNFFERRVANYGAVQREQASGWGVDPDF